MVSYYLRRKPEHTAVKSITTSFPSADALRSAASTWSRLEGSCTAPPRIDNTDGVELRLLLSNPNNDPEVPSALVFGGDGRPAEADPDSQIAAPMTATADELNLIVISAKRRLGGED